MKSSRTTVPCHMSFLSPIHQPSPPPPLHTHTHTPSRNRSQLPDRGNGSRQKQRGCISNEQGLMRVRNQKPTSLYSNKNHPFIPRVHLGTLYATGKHWNLTSGNELPSVWSENNLWVIHKDELLVLECNPDLIA